MANWAEDFRAGHITRFFLGDSAAIGIYGISQMRLSPNTEVRSERTSGAIYPDSAAVDAVKPVLSFTTFDLENAIEQLTVLGKCITFDTGKPGLVAYGQQMSCAGVGGAGVHRSMTIKQGLVVPRTLTIDHANNAQISYDAYASWDGTNDPVVLATTATMPAYAGVVYPLQQVGRWTMRGMTIASVAVLGKRSISIDFGPSVTHEAADGDRYPTVTTLAGISPVITVRGVSPSWWATHCDLDGTTATHASATIELLKRGIAIDTASHIKLTFAGLVTFDTLFDAGVDGPGESVMRINCVYDGTNAPIVATTNQTLS